MTVALAGMNHRTSAVGVRESAAVGREDLAGAAREVAGLTGGSAAVVSTCNRTELYASGRDGGALAALLAAELARRASLDAGAAARAIYTHTGAQAIGHLFRVAAGLDSMVLGEAQILGQVREAYRAAREAGCASGELAIVFERALAGGRAVRAETGIGRGAISVGSVAVELARGVFASLEGLRVLVVGTGEAAVGVLRRLAAHGVRSVRVASRSPERAAEVAGRFDAEPVRMDALAEELGRADVVLSSTEAREPVVTAGMVRAALRARGRGGGGGAGALFMLDLAVPRNVEASAGEIEGAVLYNIDHLASLAGARLKARSAELDRCRGLVSGLVTACMERIGEAGR